MKTGVLMVLAVCIALTAVYLGAQSGPVKAEQVALTGGVVTVSAGQSQARGNGTTWNQGVIITVNGVRVTADRAVIQVNDRGDNRAEYIQLAGSVRMSLPAQSKR